jgi:hypothetical protein
MPFKNRESVERVEFRWRQHEAEFAQRLAESAQEAGRTPSDHARELMKFALTSSEQLQHNLDVLRREVAQLYGQLGELRTIKEGLRLIHENIHRLRDTQATSVAKLLSDAGHLPAEDAQNWVEQIFQAE